MRLLILVTNATAPNIKDLIEAGRHHRVDYLDLAEQFSTRYLDYNIVPEQPRWRWAEELLRMDFRLAQYAARLVRQGYYDLVFSMSERVAIPLALMLDRRVRHVVQIAHPLSPVKLRTIRMLGAYRHWDVMIVPTQAEARALRKILHLGPERIRALRYPVDASYYHPFENLPPDDEPEHAESLGLSYRDYPTLIKAMHQLPHVTMYIRAGSSWVAHAAGYEREALPANIHIKPFVSPHELRECYTRSRFSVIPLRATTQWSAGCTTITQAQAMGRAVITTSNPGIGDYLLDGETGLIAGQGNPDSLARAIDRLWQDRAKAEAMGVRARQWIEEQLTVDQWMIAIKKILETEEVRS
ncbi:MAG: glycosyltransferase family 4 protein [Chloroflexota bacterium]